MLVLSRKNGESIVIDGAIKVQVVGVKGQVVRLGIEAPKEIPIHRSEIRQRIRENEWSLAAPKAASSSKNSSTIVPEPVAICKRRDRRTRRV